MPLKINGSTSGSVTLAAPATGSDVTLTLPTTALATLASPSFTGDLVWSGATLRAATALVATEQSTSSSTFTDLATSGPAVTVTTGTKALVIITTRLYQQTSGSYAWASFAVSGSSTVAASDAFAYGTRAAGADTPVIRGSAVFLVTGLTAGSNTFTLKYRADGSTAYFSDRRIIVLDMGS